MITQSHRLLSLFDESTRVAAQAVFQDRYVRAMDQLMRDAAVPIQGDHLDLPCFGGVTCPNCGAALQRANNVEHVCGPTEDDAMN